MRLAITGATGFLGRYIVNHLGSAGHNCCCWYRDGSDRGGFEAVQQRVEWVAGELGDQKAGSRIVQDCDAVVHAALYYRTTGSKREEGDVLTFAEKNILGTLRLIEAARQANVGRFVFISTCAVHDKILDDRPSVPPLRQSGDGRRFVRCVATDLGSSNVLTSTQRPA